MTIDRKPIFDAVRVMLGRGFLQTEVASLDYAIDLAEGTSSPPAAAEPSWIANARSKIGRTEIVGPKHNTWISQGWAKLKAGWFNDDETPWCGFFIADCLNDVGLPYPKNFPAAASFATFGTASPARLGAIGVKARTGGNHVFFIVGETPDKLYYKALGGNQSNRVSIVDIRKSDVTAIRWPQGASPASAALPVLPRGTISSSEA